MSMAYNLMQSQGHRTFTIRNSGTMPKLMIRLNFDMMSHDFELPIQMS